MQTTRLSVISFSPRPGSLVSIVAIMAVGLGLHGCDPGIFPPAGLNVVITGLTKVEIGKTIELTATATGAEGTVTFQWTVEVSAELSDPNSAVTELTGTGEGLVTVNVTATDQTSGETDTDVATVQVVPPPPDELAVLASADPNQAVVGDTVTLTAQVVDATGTFEYLWTQTDGPDVTIDDADTDEASVTFDEPGEYTFNVAVETDGAEGEAEVDVLVVAVIEAAFTFSPDSPVPGQSVTFDAGQSNTAEGTLTTYTWDFDDGTLPASVSEPVTEHTFLVGGTYHVTLTVRNSDGDTDEISHDVEVQAVDVGPTARLTVTPSSPKLGQAATFNGSASEDPDGPIVNYHWDFGDGASISTGNVSSTTHIYGRTGEFTATLTVTDSSGLTDEAQQTFEVIR